MHCGSCKSTENLHINTNRISRDGELKHTYRCTECNRKRCEKYKKTKAGKEAVYRAVLKYRAKNPERVRAWWKCRDLGTKPCEVCKFERTDKHHPDVSKPLEVVWLCRVHHQEAHRLMLQ